MLQNLFIQLVGFIGIGLYLLSFQAKVNRRLFMVQTLAYCFYSLHYYLLGALTGAASCAVNLIRSLLLCSDRKWAHGKYACAALCIGQIIVSIVTWNGCISLLPCIANIASTIGGYTNNPKKIRIANMFINSPVYMIYAILVGSWAGIVDELSSEISIIISIIRYGWNNLDEVQD